MKDPEKSDAHICPKITEPVNEITTPDITKKRSDNNKRKY
jgi:hypothetical protein